MAQTAKPGWVTNRTFWEKSVEQGEEVSTS